MAMIVTGCGNVAPDEESPDAASVSLYINEFMAENDTTIEDPDGAGGYPDWIELYNAGDSSIDLGGMYLTDNLSNPAKWRVSDGVVIPAGGYLLFWADNDEEQGDTHTNFRLDRDGESIGLFDTADSGYATIDTLTFAEQTADVSFGRFPDGSDDWNAFAQPTPGQPNSLLQD